MTTEETEVNALDQKPSKRLVADVVHIEITRETHGKLLALQQKVCEIIRGKRLSHGEVTKTRISLDKIVRLLMEFTLADETLSKWILEYNTPVEEPKKKRKKRNLKCPAPT